MRFADFPSAIDYVRDLLKHHSQKIMTARWQGVSTEGHPDMATHEITNVFFKVAVPPGPLDLLASQIGPNLPWADDHFKERVGGEPLNPPPSWVKWPYAHSADRFVKDDQFNHTYPERFWPKYAGMTSGGKTKEEPLDYRRNRVGIRYPYGDLNDLLRLLAKDPHTRQAYLPIFFPEDTGAVHGDRIPCTLGYHFLVRGNKLHLAYFIRSCDFVRHFRDDVYLAVRLQRFVVDYVRLNREDLADLTPGDFTMWVGSLHCFVNDHRGL